MIESAAGNIVIDNVDIASLGLHQLRSRLTILPQVIVNILYLT
jgi:ABC-type multidrug transport system fused ATPase/permease subunit